MRKRKNKLRILPTTVGNQKVREEHHRSVSTSNQKGEKKKRSVRDAPHNLISGVEEGMSDRIAVRKNGKGKGTDGAIYLRLLRGKEVGPFPI